MAAGTPNDNKVSDPASVASAGWRTWTTLLALVLGIVALVLLPVLRYRLVEPLHQDLRSRIEPARGVVTRIHLALAMEGTLAREFIEVRDTLLIVGYRAALADEMSAYDELAPYMRALGPKVGTEFNALRVLEARWHSAIETSISPSSGSRVVGDPFHLEEYEQLLVGAARLDEALGNAADKRWAEAEATNRAQQWMTAVVGLIALGAVMIVAWLGRGLRVATAAAMRDRAELERAVEARARLVRGITHDLKNPLTAIVGYTDLLKAGIKGPLTTEQGRSMDRIHASAMAMLKLIDDILGVSRAESGRLDIVPRKTPVGALVEEAVEEHEASATASGHRLDCSVAPDLPEICTDPQRVTQVLGNLLSNAIKYTPEGGEIAVRASLKSKNGSGAGDRWIAIEVVDSGPGIPADKAEAIFEEFSRLDEHRDKPGVGLGLAIARRIARLLEGDVTVRSAGGRGSAFTLWLPLTGTDGDGIS
ncbi:MAG: HAMP domain-containing sensor histidine kinase [Gemmatimonadales bacterium]